MGYPGLVIYSCITASSAAFPLHRPTNTYKRLLRDLILYMYSALKSLESASCSVLIQMSYDLVITPSFRQSFAQDLSLGSIILAHQPLV